MKRSSITVAGCIALSLCLSGCAGVTKQDVGVLTGGVLGGALGNQIGGGTGRVIATIGGTLAGALIGGSIGRSMDDVDKLKVNRALEKAPTNRTTSWSNPDNGNRYSVTPVSTYRKANRPCRNYVMTAIVDGKAEKIRGRACRQSDGSWKTK